MPPGNRRCGWDPHQRPEPRAHPRPQRQVQGAARVGAIPEEARGPAEAERGVAGAAAPKGRKLGHAGAIVNSGDETADAKKEALRSAGVEVSDTITRIGDAMRKAMGI